MSKVISAIIVGAVIIVTAIIFVSGYQNRNVKYDTISVTGLGSKDFTSDLIVWSGSFIRVDKDLKVAFSQMEKDREKIRTYLIDHGIDKDEIVFSSLDSERDYDFYYDKENVRHKEFMGFVLRQSVTIESKEVNKVESVSREITQIINEGIEFESNHPRYYYTELKNLKLEMIEEATKDAYQRARKIAENADASIHQLKSADMGVFQITGQHSSESYSWGGTFNTSSKEKTASITMKLEFNLD